MKRKTIKALATTMATVMCLGISTFTVPTATTRAEDSVDPTYALVNDFETAEDLYELSWYGLFGKARINTDARYVSNGNSSARLNPIGDYRAGTNPTYIKIHLDRHKAHDASRLTSVSFDVFNASTADQKVSCALAIDKTNTKYVDFTIKKDEKTTITLEYDLIAMSAAYDTSKVEGIYVKFPKAIDRETQDENIYYLDNFSAKYTPFASKGYEIKFEGNEFCTFDESYHEFLVNNNCGVGSIEGYRPELELNTNPLFCADKADEGFVFGKNKSLKVVAKGGGTTGNPGFTFSDKVWHNFEWSEMNDKALQFDVYNDSESPFGFSLIIFRNPDNYRTDYYDRYSKGFTVPAYSWLTVTLPIKEMNESTKNTNGNPMTSYVQYGKRVYTYGTPTFIYNNASVGTADRTFYFDNFRIADVNA